MEATESVPVAMSPEDFQSALVAIGKQYARATTAKPAQSAEIELLVRDIADLKDAMARIEQCACQIIPVNSFAPEPFVPAKEIKVVVQFSGDDYLASFVDANIHASGATLYLAVEGVKAMMLSLYQRYSAMPEHKLGRLPTKQLAVLREFVKPRG